MPRISCDAQNCRYNENCNCTLEKPEIGGRGADRSDETLCESFTDRSAFVENSVTHPVLQNNAVHCKAKKCRFNEKGFCLSDVINVSGRNAKDGDGTECRTFSKPIL